MQITWSLNLKVDIYQACRNEKNSWGEGGRGEGEGGLSINKYCWPPWLANEDSKCLKWLEKFNICSGQVM